MTGWSVVTYKSPAQPAAKANWSSSCWMFHQPCCKLTSVCCICRATSRAWVRRLVYHYETPEQAEKDIADWAELDIIVLRLRPTTVIKVM